MNTNDCVEHTCANGGICVDGVGNYTCRCPLQYAGTWGVSVWGAEGPNPWPEPHSHGQQGWGPASVCAGGSCRAACLAELRGQPLSCLSLLLSPGRACEQLVDFCSPDLNPCQHKAQCVGTPDGPRSVLPISRAREGQGLPRCLPVTWPVRQAWSQPRRVPVSQCGVWSRGQLCCQHDPEWMAAPL